MRRHKHGASVTFIDFYSTFIIAAYGIFTCIFADAFCHFANKRIDDDDDLQSTQQTLNGPVNALFYTVTVSINE